MICPIDGSSDEDVAGCGVEDLQLTGVGMEGEFGGGPEGGFLDLLFHRRDGERVIVSAEMTYRRMIEDLWFVYSIFVFGHGFTSGSLWLRGEAGWRWSGRGGGGKSIGMCGLRAVRFICFLRESRFGLGSIVILRVGISQESEKSPNSIPDELSPG